MSTYYNENDPFAAAWLRELIRHGHIATGDVDERDIREVQPDDVRGYTQAHFFAGIGGWSLALRLAGWSDDRPVWTGSCPCQPFSAAAQKRKGAADKRHLWPEFFRLIRECHPSVCFGEQVASADGRKWLAGVRADLEAMGCRFGAADLCAASTGEEAEGWILRRGQLVRERIVLSAPHIRPRLWWVADTGRAIDERLRRSREAPGAAGSHADEAQQRQWRRAAAGAGGAFGEEHHGLAVAPSDLGDGWQQEPEREAEGRTADRRNRPGLGDTEHDGLRVGRRSSTDLPDESGYWSLFDIAHCRDGKARRLEPGLEPLADGIPDRVGRLRGYGNAIVPEVGAAFIAAYDDYSPAPHRQLAAGGGNA